MKTIAVIEQQNVNWDSDAQVLTFQGRGRIDNDGTGSAHGDRFHQAQTSLRHHGAYLNADVDRYIVLPGHIIRELPGIFLGCQARVCYRGKWYAAVVGDIGPNNRLGEISEALAGDMGINQDPNTGGDDNADILFEVHPGTPAEVDGTAYQLQAA